ncbi:alanine--glyoxylate aminotransferase 2 [Perkinsus chesapeaki]|uniref:alanine--glyoxylate transaminase n=1 Tax=Perkinsus chesapeaki TaxID=330153 RepID=A0A7J6KZ46_PERCH|nr:alanine--glyoxylate aminotransferase 2 [Perkinsus chesapeaki]
MSRRALACSSPPARLLLPRLFSTSPAGSSDPLNEGFSHAEIFQMRQKYLGPLTTLYDEPLVITKGFMQHLFDDSGRKYLDLIGGIVTVSVGHCHPRITEVIQRQSAQLVHITPLYANAQPTLYAKELVEHLPARPDGKQWKVYFVNSGSEANDLATMLARLYTGRWPIVALRNGYHGMTGGTQGITAVGFYKHQVPSGFGIDHLAVPKVYNTRLGPNATVEDIVRYHLQDLDDHLDSCFSDGQVAGYLSESTQGVGGVVTLPPGYLQGVYERIRAAGGICIADEVQTGFGRTGTNFWGFQNHDVMPDVVTMAKSIGNGMPLAAVVAREDVMDALGKKAFFNTYGGGLVQTAVGREVLRIIDEDGLMKHSHDVGGHLLSNLHQLKAKYPSLIGDVRGTGLLIGIEHTGNHAASGMKFVWNRLKDKGFLVGGAGPHGTIIRLAPPMCITKDDIDQFCSALDDSYSEAIGRH